MSSPNCNQQLLTSDCTAVVWTRSAKPDPYAGLKGHDYIAARNLNQPIKRVQTSALSQKAGKGK